MNNLSSRIGLLIQRHDQFLPLLYGIAALIGLGGALYITLGEPEFAEANTGIIAFVNGEPIPDTEYARALEAMQAGLQRPLSTDDRKRAYQVLIDEELIVQEALRLDLAKNDRLTRNNLIQAMIRSITLLEAQPIPTEEALQQFYRENRTFFAVPKQLTVKLAQSPNEEASKNFLNALREKNRSFEDAQQLAGLTIVPTPTDLPLAKIGDLFGGSVRDAITEMTPGDIAGPISSRDKTFFIWLLTEKGGVRSFSEVRESVQQEWQRRQEEKALERYIARLRQNARIKTFLNPEDIE